MTAQRRKKNVILFMNESSKIRKKIRYETRCEEIIFIYVELLQNTQDKTEVPFHPQEVLMRSLVRNT